jgi:ribonucleotide reductase beta subunit family protein with ferritin-like domain
VHSEDTKIDCGKKIEKYLRIYSIKNLKMEQYQAELNKIRDLEAEEELLSEHEKSRFVVYPIKYTHVWDMYKTAVSAFWSCEEIDCSKDFDDWKNKLSQDERFFISNVLAFFAASDGLVGENLGTRFYEEVKIPEARAFYANQMFMETIHNEMYSLMIDTLIKDPLEKDRLFNGLETIPCIKKKGEWSYKWITSKEAPFVMRLIAFAIIEGVFFSGSFCAIFWMKERNNLLPGLTSSNELISRDESLHTEFAILLHSMIKNKLSQQIVHDMFKEAVDIETEYITQSIPCKMLGMNADLMSQYIRFVADRLLVQLGYDKIYDDMNPFPFMDRIGLSNKTNFFEHTRVTEYAKAKVGKKDVYKFSLDEAF